MITYTERLEAAIRFASQKHDGLYRAGPGKLPCVSHLFSVAILISNYTDDEDILIAGLLHDVLEDTSVTADELIAAFGPRVFSFVEGVTEMKGDSWRIQKEGYHRKLRSAPVESLIISSADKIHNIQSKLELLAHIDNSSGLYWSHSVADYTWHHKEVLDAVRERLVSPIVSRLEEVCRAEIDFMTKHVQ